MTNEQFDACMRQIQSGDKQGLKLIYEDYKAYIFAVMRSVCGRQEDAEDLTVDFFVRIWQQAGSYRPGSGHRTWMTKIARNMAVDFVRKSGREFLSEEVRETDEGDVTSPSAEEEALEKMTFKEAIATLSAQKQQIMVMKIAGQMTFEEIAQILGIPIGTVTWHYQDSLKRLRRVAI